MPRRLVLSVNAGSSSLKISLYLITNLGDKEPASLLLTSTISSIFSPPVKFSFEPNNNDASASVRDAHVDSIHDHEGAFSHFVQHLRAESSIDSDEIVHICHRIVHGGDYQDPVIINDKTYHHIENLSDLAPLHNGAALAVITACIKDLPNASSIAYFDTAFHRSIPSHIANYAINQEIAKKRGLRKYGFHGLSYSFMLRAVSRFLQQPSESLNLILLHLGSGASVCAIKQGKSYDTSMGLTPVSGLPGATRSGAIDPSLIFHYTNKAGKITHDPGAATDLHVTEAERILNLQSGWKALTGTTDFALITARVFHSSTTSSTDLPNLTQENAEMAFHMFTDRILNYIGSYHLKLHGRIDAIVFAGGLGEHSAELRKVISKGVECLGFRIDEERNQNVNAIDGDVVNLCLGHEKDKRVLVCRTDEQLEMARQCALEEKFWREV